MPPVNYIGSSTSPVRVSGSVGVETGAENLLVTMDDATTSLLVEGTIDSSSLSFSQSAVFMNGDNQVLENTAGGVLRANGSTVQIVADTSGSTIFNAGLIDSTERIGISVFGNEASVFNTGTITASLGVSLDGGANYLQNNATISATLTGAVIRGIGSERPSTLLNSGTIEGGNFGTFVLGDGNTLINAGQITSEGIGIRVTAENTTIVNSGTITGGEEDILMERPEFNFDPGFVNTIVNSGLIEATDGPGP